MCKASKIWFPRWLGRYAALLRCGDEALIPVDRERVIQFLRMLRDRSVPAWQRLQAVEALECYQTRVAGE